MVDQESLIKEIKSLSDSIRAKNRALKLGISERDGFIETTFKPVVGSLKEISNKLENNVPSIAERRINPLKYLQQQELEDGKTTGSDDGSEDDYVEANSDIEDEQSTKKSEEGQDMTLSNLSVLAKDISSKGLLSRKYLIKMLHDPTKQRGYHVYGARLENDGIMIGNVPLEIDEEDNLLIKGKTYPGTQGVFELIFKQVPAKFSTRDLKMFKNILIATNAHRKHYLSTQPIHRNTSKKYKSVIVKLFPPRSTTTTGHGLTMKNLYETNIIYYNNINKVVDRLRLLWESKEAGHTGLDNEIVALTDELRKRGYIS